MRKLYQINLIYRRVVKVTLITLGSLVGLVILAILLLQIPAVQDYVALKVISGLEKSFETEIDVDHVHLRGLSSFEMEGFLMKDQHGDTLIAAHELNIKFNLWQLLNAKFDISDATLDGAVVNLQRKSSYKEFNYAFLKEAFSSDNSSSGGGSWTIDADNLVLTNSHFKYFDEPRGEKMSAQLALGRFNFNDIDVEEQRIAMDEIYLENSLFAIYYLLPDTTYQYGTPTLPVPAARPADSIYGFNAGNWYVELGNFEINNATFINKNLTPSATPSDGIDWDDLQVENIHLRIGEMEMVGDTIYGHINGLNFQEQSGFKLNSLTAGLKFNPRAMRLSGLFVKTDRSEIKGKFALQYEGFDAFGDFINSVYMDATLRNTVVKMQDLKYFIPSLPHDPDQQYYIDGHFQGTVSGLVGTDLKLAYADHTRFSGQLEMYGLPVFQETYIDFTVDDFKTTRTELQEMLPPINLPTQLGRMGVMDFQGDFTGFFNDFVANGVLHSNLGKVSADIKLNTKSAIPVYSGELATDHFQLGKWMDNPLYGDLTIKIDSIRGQGFEWRNLGISGRGNISQFEVNGYNYQDVAFNGQIKQRFFDGRIISSDPNLKMNFDGTIDFKGEAPNFDLYADIGYADLQKLHITDQPYQIQTQADLQFVGDDINHIEGRAFLLNPVFTAGKDIYRLDTIELISHITPEERLLAFHSEVADIELKGQFLPLDLAPAITRHLNRYYDVIPVMDEPVSSSNTNFTYSINIKEDHPLVKILLPQVEGLAGIEANGSFNDDRDLLSVDATIPHLHIGDYDINGGHFSVTSNRDTLKINGTAAKFNLGGGFVTLNNQIDTRIFDDKLNFQVEFDKDSLLQHAQIAGIAYSLEDSVVVKFGSSNITLKDNLWNINPNGVFTYKNNNIFFDNLKLQSDGQDITLNSSQREGKEGLQLNMDNVLLEELMQLIGYNEFQLSGTINGDLMAYDLLNKDKSKFDADLKITEFAFEGDTLGTVTAKADFTPQSNRLDLLANLIGPDVRFTIDGYYDIAGKQQAVDFKVNMDSVPVQLAEPFLTGVLSELEGVATGQFLVKGTLQNPDLSGEAVINNAKARLDFFGTRYTFDPLQVKLNKKYIRVNNAFIYDRNGKRAEMDGEIAVLALNDIRFEEFYINTLDPGFVLMNTTAADNEFFYGQAYGKAVVLMSGPLNDLDISVAVTSDENTEISIPIVSGSGSGQYEFVNFVQSKEDSIRQAEYAPSLTGLDLDLTMYVTHDAIIRLIFDEQAGDVVEGRGTGNLQMYIDQYGEITMYGNYTVDEGDYLFTMQDFFINKEFDIQKGGTITFSGDPYDAYMNINAIYRVDNANPADLFATGEISEVERDQLSTSIPIDVYLRLTGLLSDPQISFDLAPAGGISVGATYGAFDNKLQAIRNDPDELNKQVFGLIVFNQFLPPSFGTEFAQAGSQTLDATLTEFISSRLSLYFNDLLSDYGLEVDFGLDNYQVNDANRTALELEIRRRMGRFAVSVGGNYDFGAANETAASSSQLRGDFELEYSLTKDGRLRVKAFRRSDNSILDQGTAGNVNRNGAGLFYVIEFDSIGDLFRSKEKRDAKDAVKENASKEDGESTPTTQKTELDDNPPEETPK